MNIERRITAFAALGDFVLKNPVSLQEIVNKTFIYNTWFTIDNINQALQNIAIEFLNKEKLENWISGYGSKITTHDTKTIAIVAAGNIPMVAFHDILCVLISGNKLQLKLSEKDQYLLPFLLEQLINIEPDFKELIYIQLFCVQVDSNKQQI